LQNGQVFKVMSTSAERLLPQAMETSRANAQWNTEMIPQAKADFMGQAQ
jgi:hypothetical protein